MDGSDQLVACVGHRPACSAPRRLDVWGRRVVRVWSIYDVTVGGGFRTSQERLVRLTFASWNQLTHWLRQLDAIRTVP
jgi:hypothetical protein